MRQAMPQLIAAIGEILEQLIHRWMVNRAAFRVVRQVLLADIGDIAVFAVFSEQVVIGLLAVGLHFLGDRIVPFLAVGKDRVDVENNAAKIIELVPHDIANGETCLGTARRVDQSPGLRRIITRARFAPV